MKTKNLAIFLAAIMAVTPLAYAGSSSASEDIPSIGTARLMAVLADKLGDRNTVFSWLKIAAEQGDAESQNRVGMMYLNGDGTAKNEVEARRWFKISADQGNEDAKDNVKFLAEQDTNRNTNAAGIILGGLVILGIAAAAATSEPVETGPTIRYPHPIFPSPDSSGPDEDTSIGCAWGNRTDGTCH